ncbi:MAG: hypothetical protein ACLSCV_06330 [Acutalibacteraceae bacterium]
MSFTRLTDMAFRAYGGSGIAKLDDGGRNTFMNLALEGKRRAGVLCNTCGKLIPFMLSMSAELKMCAIAPAVLLKQHEDRT